MNDRRLSDAQIASALRAHLPAEAPSGVTRRLLAAVERTPQQRPLLPVVGWVWNANPIDLRSSLVVLIALLLAAALAALAAAGAWRIIAPQRISAGWIAYSTDGPAPGSTDAMTGSDIYLVREGGTQTLVAGRDGGATRNACPSFSPDGARLAYGVGSAGGRAIVVRGVNATGLTEESIRIPVPGGGLPVCVRWSADGRRLAYFDGGTEVVVGLDGSASAPAPGDPSPADLASPQGGRPQVLSPSGEWAARMSDGGACQLVVARPDGTDVHVIPLHFCPYAIAAWSPDSTRVLLMVDVSGLDFSIYEVWVDRGAQSVVVSTVRTDGARSWPGLGDVSWQPVLP